MKKEFLRFSSMDDAPVDGSHFLCFTMIRSWRVVHWDDSDHCHCWTDRHGDPDRELGCMRWAPLLRPSMSHEEASFINEILGEAENLSSQYAEVPFSKEQIVEVKRGVFRALTGKHWNPGVHKKPKPS